MRILQIISHYLPSISFGGPLRVAHGLGHALVKQGHEVIVCCTNMLDVRTNLERPIGRPVTIDGVRVFYHSVPILRYWGFSPALAYRVASEVKAADVVFTHFHYQFATAIGGWYARLWKKPLVVFTHGSLNKYGLQGSNQFLKRIYIHLIEKENFRKALFVAYNSSGERDQSLRLGDNHLIIPSGVDVEPFQEAPARGTFRKQYPELRSRFLFVYLGRLAGGKGLDLLLDALYEIVRLGRDAHLVVCGGDERGYKNSIVRQAERLRLVERITFTGVVDGIDKLAALRDADVFVLPSRSEGTSIVTLEAMAMRLPVIVTDRVGQWQDVVSNQCGLVTAYDSRSLTKAMLEMMDRDDREEMGQRGFDVVSAHYRWDSIAKKLVDEIEAMQLTRVHQL